MFLFIITKRGQPAVAYKKIKCVPLARNSAELSRTEVVRLLGLHSTAFTFLGLEQPLQISGKKRIWSRGQSANCLFHFCSHFLNLKWLYQVAKKYGLCFSSWVAIWPTKSQGGSLTKWKKGVMDIYVHLFSSTYYVSLENSSFSTHYKS